MSAMPDRKTPVRIDKAAVPVKDFILYFSVIPLSPSLPYFNYFNYFNLPCHMYTYNMSAHYLHSGNREDLWTI
jgi:hypothetical protein